MEISRNTFVDEVSDDDYDMVFESLQNLLKSETIIEENEDNNCSQQEQLDRARKERESLRQSLFGELEIHHDDFSTSTEGDDDSSSYDDHNQGGRVSAERYIADRVFRSSEYTNNFQVNGFFSRPIIFAPQRTWRKKKNQRSQARIHIEKVYTGSLTPQSSIDEDQASCTKSTLRRLPQPIDNWYVRVHSLTPPKIGINV